MALSNSVLKKYNHLQKIFTEMDSVIVAYSGGVDDSLLLKVGTDTLKENCTGIIGLSPSLSPNEYQEAEKQATLIGANLAKIQTNEINHSLYVQNNLDRCYFCKSELFSRLVEISKELGVNYIVEGSNFDDLNDHRPGMRAAGENKIRSPLVEVKLKKKEIREVAKYLKISSWDKPSQPCLSSRVAYGVKINEDILYKISKAEEYLKNLDFKIVRVRYFDNYVSVEVGEKEITRLFTPEIKQKVKTKFQNIGLNSIVFDPEGYKSGKLNIIQNAS